HLARANPHSRSLGGRNTLVIFNGPSTYVTPRWYRDPLNVPTWNYAVVHAQGVPSLVEDFEGIRSILVQTTERFESGSAKPWTLDLPRDFEAQLVGAIVGFKIPLERIEAKFKLSQNRSPADREGVLQDLRERTDEMSRKILGLMTRE